MTLARSALFLLRNVPKLLLRKAKRDAEYVYLVIFTFFFVYIYLFLKIVIYFIFVFEFGMFRKIGKGAASVRRRKKTGLIGTRWYISYFILCKQF
jgi:hypothetical protein